MSILNQGKPLEGMSLVDRIADALRHGGAMAALAGSAEAVEMIVEAVRGTVAAELVKLVDREIEAPRKDEWGDGRWPTSEGFYLTVTAARLEQVLDSIGAVTALHRAGSHRAGWAVLEQAADSLTRLWMFTEAFVFDQPWDEARRSAHAWVEFAGALDSVTGIAELAPHPFDTAYDGEVSEAEEKSMHVAADGASEQAKRLVTAVRAGARLAGVNIPAHLQIDPGAGSGIPTTGVGITSSPTITAQLHLAAELVRSAAASTQSALDASRDSLGG
ncbi:hypothetical protein FK531_21995 [Rhodococcus spelaei]|uniref:Uncharacterized protein n=1 Tax=Rhodococcus spelaei TaxID=2546320 RepID=A0A541AZ34_9NOCA|nr:hypothetical protein [Rhodococcus spelaei]TQF65294.1 hypothetical protein FK531_21995 [Rhodococcus spelaei]